MLQQQKQVLCINEKDVSFVGWCGIGSLKIHVAGYENIYQRTRLRKLVVEALIL
jgi:hypothetical protein